jgi:catechol 2,3-dioxygenase-like lactoylglutathione lyase family enzyme
MLGDAPLAPTIPVTDLDKAKEFYVDKLGLKLQMEDPAGGLLLEAGDGTKLYVYKRAPSKADHTLASFTVKDIYKTVDELNAKGIKMEHYGEPFNTDDKGVAKFGETMKGAWFKDPDGNILSLDQM